MRPNQLPPEYLATTTVGASQVDLSRLARSEATGQRIYAGDLLRISVLTGLETEESAAWPPLRVSERGTVDLPLIGEVAVAGLDFDGAEQVIRTEGVRRGIYTTPYVTVSLQQRRVNRITVVGAVQEPGVKELPATDCNVFSALVAAGGMTADAAPLVELHHPATSMLAAGPAGDQVRTAAYQPGSHAVTPGAVEQIDLLQSPPAQRQFQLEDGAVVMVVEQPARTVHVMGLVNNPSEIKMPKDRPLRILDAVAQAGGLSLQVANKVHVIRTVPNRAEPVVIATSIRAAKTEANANLVLAAGDVVSVEETPVTFTVAMLRTFIRFGFTGALPGI